MGTGLLTAENCEEREKRLNRACRRSGNHVRTLVEIRESEVILGQPAKSFAFSAMA
jgi:hypothetical protein